jgi:hypothetical protein
VAKSINTLNMRQRYIQAVLENMLSILVYNSDNMQIAMEKNIDKIYTLLQVTFHMFFIPASGK